MNLVSEWRFSNLIVGDALRIASSIASIIATVSAVPHVKQSMDSQPFAE